MSAPTPGPPLQSWPPPTGRPAGPGSRGLLALGLCLLVVAGLSLLGQRWQETPVHWVDASVGEQADGRRYDAEVAAVRLATTVQGPQSYAEPLTTAYRYVVVDLVVEVEVARQTFSEIVLETSDGHRYAPRTEFPQLESCEPGFTAYGAVVFEVPPDRVPSARLILGPETGSFRVYDTALRFDLGLTPATPPVGVVTLAEGRQEVTG